MRYVMTSSNVAPFAMASLADMLVSSANLHAVRQPCAPRALVNGDLIVITADRLFDIASLVPPWLTTRLIPEHSRRRLPNTPFAKRP